MGEIELLKLVLQGGVAGIVGAVALVALFVVINRDKGEAKAEERQGVKEMAYIELISELSGNMRELSGNIRASTDAIIALKTCEDETQTIVSGFRREVQGVHGTQLDRLDAIQGALAELPGLTAQAVRVSLMDDLLASRAKIDEAIDKIAALREIDKAARPITPGRSIESAVERVRIEQAAREQMATMDARKTGEHAVAPPAGERVTDANEQQGG